MVTYHTTCDKCGSRNYYDRIEDLGSPCPICALMEEKKRDDAKHAASHEERGLTQEEDGS